MECFLTCFHQEKKVAEPQYGALLQHNMYASSIYPAQQVRVRLAVETKTDQGYHFKENHTKLSRTLLLSGSLCKNACSKLYFDSNLDVRTKQKWYKYNPHFLVCFIHTQHCHVNASRNHFRCFYTQHLSLSICLYLYPPTLKG